MTRRGSGGSEGSGGAAPIWEVAALYERDDDLLTEDEVFDLLRIAPEARHPALLMGIPYATVGAHRRWIRGQVLSWLALGGTSPRRPARMQRGGLAQHRNTVPGVR